MEEKPSMPDEPDFVPESGRTGRGLWVAIIVLLCVVAVSLGYMIDQHKISSQLSGKNQELMASLGQTKGQVDALSQRLNEMQAAQQDREKEREEASRQRARAYHARAHRAAVHHHKDDPRWKQVESELAAHQKAIDSNQQDLAQARSDLQNSLDTTRNQLSGSIARTHGELVALEKKGERNYYEFDLNRSKYFHRIGPINVSLRKTNTKHQFVNLHLLVDDKDLTKKHVNLYEPVVFYTDRTSQPLELVINEINKNHMHGYVSAPKYSAADLARASSASKPTPAQAPATTTVGALQHRPEPLR